MGDKMDAAHIHLVLTHFPILGTLFGIGVLIYGIYSGKDSIKTLALATFILMTIITIPVFLTGEGAEELVEKLVNVDGNIIEEHEELAEKAIWFMGLLSISSLINLFAIYKKKSFRKIIILITLITSMLTFGLFVKVGNLGGQIRHSEIRADQINSQDEIKNDKQNDIKKKRDDDDDD